MSSPCNSRQDHFEDTHQLPVNSQDELTLWACCDPAWVCNLHHDISRKCILPNMIMKGYVYMVKNFQSWILLHPTTDWLFHGVLGGATSWRHQWWHAWWCHSRIDARDGGLQDRPRSQGRPRDLILMASVSVLAAHVSVSEVPALSTGSRELASLSRPASKPNLDGLGLGLGHPCLGLGGPGLDYNPDLHLKCLIT